MKIRSVGAELFYAYGHDEANTLFTILRMNLRRELSESRCRQHGCCNIMNGRIQAGISLPVNRREALRVASFLQLFLRKHSCDTCKIVTNIRVLEMTVFNTDVTIVHTLEYCDVFVKWVSIHPAVELKTSVKCSITASNKIMGNWTCPVLTLPPCCVRGVGYRLWWCVPMCLGA
jgi:hypothetical protein